MLVAVAAIAMSFAPETVAPRRPFRLQTVAVSIPSAAFRLFALATFVEMTAYAVAGTFAGLGPSFAHDLLGVKNHFFAGLVVARLFVCSALSQLLFKHWPHERCMQTGLGTLLVGLALFAFGVLAHSAAAFLLSAAVLGAGHGLAYLGSRPVTGLGALSSIFANEEVCRWECVAVLVEAMGELQAAESGSNRGYGLGPLHEF